MQGKELFMLYDLERSFAEQILFSFESLSLGTIDLTKTFSVSILN